MVLRKGNRGSEVGSLQLDLILVGFGVYVGKHDSIFGKMTEKAVKKFQAWAKIKVDGLAGNQTMKALVQAKTNAGSKGTYNFSINEFRCKGSGTLPKNGMDNVLIMKLEQLRYMLGNKPMIITSGYRSHSHNQRVGGASNSQHLYGRASDIQVRGVRPDRVYDVANVIFSNGGLGKYKTFTHVDTRGYRARF